MPAAVERSLLEGYLEARRLEAAAAKRKQVFATAIQEAMGEATEVHVGPFRVCWTPVERSVLDQKRLKAENPGLCEHYSQVQHTRRFEVKVD